MSRAPITECDAGHLRQMSADGGGSLIWNIPDAHRIRCVAQFMMAHYDTEAFDQSGVQPGLQVVQDLGFAHAGTHGQVGVGMRFERQSIL